MRAERRGLIIDLDDTVYPRSTYVRSGCAAVARYAAGSHDVSSQEAYGTLARAMATGEPRSAFQALCARHGLPGSMLPGMLDAFRSHEPELWLSDAVEQTLADLRQSGWRVAILTNGLPSVQKKKVAALRLGALVDHVLYAEEIATGGKPAAPVFREALGRLGVTASRTVCVGDDPFADVAGARALGIHTIRLARPGMAPAPEFEADAVVDRFDQVPAVAAALLTSAEDGDLAHVA